MWSSIASFILADLKLVLSITRGVTFEKKRGSVVLNRAILKNVHLGVVSSFKSEPRSGQQCVDICIKIRLALLVARCPESNIGVTVEKGECAGSTFGKTDADDVGNAMPQLSGAAPYRHWTCMIEQLVIVVGLVARRIALDGRLAKITRNFAPRLRTCRLDIACHFACQGRIVDGLGRGLD
jgi:hypothetical protein